MTELLNNSELDSKQVIIEKAAPEDAETICDIRDRAWLKAYPNAELGITTEDIRIKAQGQNGEFVPRRIEWYKKQFANNENNNPTYVAKVDGVVTGYIELWIDEKGHQTFSIYIAPEYQGVGLGTKLMNKMLSVYRRKNDIYLEVVSYNQNAIDFYERFGFVKTDNTVPIDKNKPDYIKDLPLIEMVLRAK